MFFPERAGERHYPARLGHLLGSDYVVRNFGRPATTMLPAGFAGAAPWSATEEAKAFLAFRPDVVVIMLGTNDSKEGLWNEAAFRTAYLKAVADLHRGVHTPRRCRSCHPCQPAG